MTEIDDAWKALNKNGFALDYDEDSRPGSLAKAIDYALAAKDDEIGRLDARIIELGAMVERQQWKPIETAPQNTEVLICGIAYGKPYCAVAKLENGIWMQFDPMTDYYGIESDGHTHWMAIPTFPSTDGSAA